MARISRSDGMIIESFRGECSVAGGPAYGDRVFELDTAFGFFPAEMLRSRSACPPPPTSGHA